MIKGVTYFDGVTIGDDSVMRAHKFGIITNFRKKVLFRLKKIALKIENRL